MPEQIPYSRKLGPLTPFVGEWEGDAGVDSSYHNKDDWTTETTYFEKAWFKPIPVQENGQQVLWGLHYGMTAWRHGEEAMDPFHDEVGFLLWDKAHQQVMRNVVFGRGIAILAGSKAEPHDKVLRFDARPGEPCYGILQNKYLLQRAEIRDFKSDFTVNDDGTLGRAEFFIGKAKFFLADEWPVMGAKSSLTLGGYSVSLAITVDDADSFALRLADAGSRSGGRSRAAPSRALVPGG